MRRLLWIVATALWALVAPRRTLADGHWEALDPLERSANSSDEEEEAARGLYFLGEQDEKAMRFSDAVTHYDASIARFPSGRYAQSAAARSSNIKAHSEGQYGPLLRLETVRRDPEAANRMEAIEGLVRDADGFPPGPVRVEARLLAAEAYRGRFHRPREEVRLLWLVVNDPSASVVESRLAAAGIVLAEIAQNDLDAAERAQIELGARLDATHTRMVARLLRRRTAAAFATLGLGVVLAWFGIATARRGRDALRAALRALPLTAAFSLFVGVGGGLLSSAYEPDSATPFLLLVPAIFMVSLIARVWGAVGSKAATARLFRALVCASSLCAVAFLMIDRLTPKVLDGLGL